MATITSIVMLNKRSGLSGGTGSSRCRAPTGRKSLQIPVATRGMKWSLSRTIERRHATRMRVCAGRGDSGGRRDACRGCSATRATNGVCAVSIRAKITAIVIPAHRTRQKLPPQAPLEHTRDVVLYNFLELRFWRTSDASRYIVQNRQEPFTRSSQHIQSVRCYANTQGSRSTQIGTNSHETPKTSQAFYWLQD